MGKSREKNDGKDTKNNNKEFNDTRSREEKHVGFHRKRDLERAEMEKGV